MKKSTYHYFFSNLANPLRVQIVECLKGGGKSVSDIVKNLKIEQSKVSHALVGLRECNIVEVEQVGKHRIYSLNKKTIIPILKLIDNHAKLNCGGNCACCNRK